MKKITLTCDVCGKELNSEYDNHPLKIGQLQTDLMCVGTAPYPHPHITMDLCEKCAYKIIEKINL